MAYFIKIKLTFRWYKNHAEWRTSLRHHLRCHCRKRTLRDGSSGTPTPGHRRLSICTHKTD